MATTIEVEIATRDQLRSIGRKGESYNSVIKRLLRANEYVSLIDEQYSILKRKKDWRRLGDLP
jgi:hypothetical protein